MLWLSEEARKRTEELAGKAEAEAQKALSGDGFLESDETGDARSALNAAKASAASASHALNSVLHLTPKGFRGMCQHVISEADSFNARVAGHNEEIASVRRQQVRSVMPVEGRDLDRQQIEAIACDYRTRLIIAGAGTGKTTTVVGLVKDLVLNGRADPSEILVVSFTNASVDELKERLKKETGKDVHVSTFHKLGLDILREADGIVPKITGTELRVFVTDSLERLVKDPRYLRKLNDYLTYDCTDGRDETDFRSAEEMSEYFQSNPIMTLRGERVKSLGEQDIANFLFLNGIEYEYEEVYGHDTRTADRGQYRPDFHVKGTDVYIEYFGTDRNGNVAPWFASRDGEDPSQRYLEGIRWKRDTHRHYRTKLVEAYAYERAEGTLIDSLGKRLKEAGVEPRPVPDADILRRLRSRNLLGEAASQFTTSISLIRNTGRPFEDLFGGVRDPRVLRIAALIRPIYDAYLDKLGREGSIDFSDMLNLAARRIAEGKYRCPYTRVIVDEYQDISAPSFRLLKAMRGSDPYRLFCVGDDWQSIYRFNGSDVGYIMDFPGYWGESHVYRIERTYRFSGKLLDESSAFVMRNPRQVKKKLTGPADRPGFIGMAWTRSQSEVSSAVRDRIRQLPQGCSVLLLGRYNFDLNLLSKDDFRQVRGDPSAGVGLKCSGRPDADVRFMTVHGAKGLQADYVFILNTRSGRLGFPNMMAGSPLIDMLLEGSDDYPFAEERRLFYVALTRAKRETFLVLVRNNVGIFAREVLGDIVPRGSRYRVCPRCGAMLVLRTSRRGGKFWGCSNFGRTGCTYTENPDPRR